MTLVIRNEERAGSGDLVVSSLYISHGIRTGVALVEALCTTRWRYLAEVAPLKQTMVGSFAAARPTMDEFFRFRQSFEFCRTEVLSQAEREDKSMPGKFTDGDKPEGYESEPAYPCELRSDRCVFLIENQPRVVVEGPPPPWLTKSVNVFPLPQQVRAYWHGDCLDLQIGRVR